MGMDIVISLIILFVGIAILVSIHVCIVGRAFSYGGSAPQGQSSTTTKTISSDHLKNLPCFNYEEPEKGCGLLDCAVCLENFKAGDVCRLLPNCSHSFHVQCIDSWIVKTPFCPICRTWVHSRAMMKEESVVSDNVEIEIA
ncbi:Zinc finger, RING-type [Sesbania bispinosa]|nr:Zinc finger, RING-type [Sesbania bispinosa]